MHGYTIARPRAARQNLYLGPAAYTLCSRVDCDGSSSLKHLRGLASTYGYVTRPPSPDCNDHVILFMGLKFFFVIWRSVVELPNRPRSLVYFSHVTQCFYFELQTYTVAERTDESVLRSQKRTCCDLAHARRTCQMGTTVPCGGSTQRKGTFSSNTPIAMACVV